MNKIKKYIRFLSDFILILLFSPIYSVLIINLLLRKKEKKKIALFAGLEHVIDKSALRGDKLNNEGYKVFFYTYEKTGNKCSSRYHPEILKTPKLSSADILFFLKILININPAYLEIYFEGLGWRQFFYTLFARINRTLVITILRGELYYYHTSMHQMKKKAIRNTLFLCNYIFYREMYMLDILSEMNIPLGKMFFDPNSIIVKEEPIYKKDEKVVLFLNGLKKWRRIDLIIEAIPNVIKLQPSVKFVLVGARNKAEKEYVMEFVRKFDVEQYVELLDWTNEPQPFYNRASLFVLPADLIYCNFSLLEAMERGVPAIVADVEDADKIITHGINGFLVKQNANDIAKYIIELLSNEKKRLEMGVAARKTIIEKFNDKDRMQPILKLIKENIIIQDGSLV